MPLLLTIEPKPFKDWYGWTHFYTAVLSILVLYKFLESTNVLSFLWKKLGLFSAMIGGRGRTEEEIP